MEGKKARKKLSLAKAVEQGGFYRPLTLEQEAAQLRLSGKFVRSSLSLNHTTDEEQLYATRQGLVPAASNPPHNSYTCIQDQKRLLSRLKKELSPVDKLLARTGLGAFRAKRRLEEPETFFLTRIETGFEEISLSTFEKTATEQPLPPLYPSKPFPNKHVSVLKRAASVVSPRTRLSSLSTQCDSMSSSISATKSGLIRETLALQAQWAVSLRHLQVLEIAKRRWKYYNLRKTFQRDTKVRVYAAPYEALVGTVRSAHPSGVGRQGRLVNGELLLLRCRLP